jgi:pyridoxine kinase
MGIECAIIPTAVLSTHTGGFEGFTLRDISEDIPKISNHWQKYNIGFDTIYTGYLASKEQIDHVIAFVDDFKKENTLVFVDPAMADKGKLYTGFDKDFPAEMARLCSKADIIVPNITEASFLTNSEYKESYDESYIKELLVKLCDLGAKKALLTGVSYESSTQGAVFYDSETKEYISYFNENIPTSFHGTGDTFASVFAGGLTLGYSYEDSMKLAVDYTVKCIKDTVPYASTHSYGTMFESSIPYLIERLKK